MTLMKVSYNQPNVYFSHDSASCDVNSCTKKPRLIVRVVAQTSEGIHMSFPGQKNIFPLLRTAHDRTVTPHNTHNRNILKIEKHLLT